MTNRRRSFGAHIRRCQPLNRETHHSDGRMKHWFREYRIDMDGVLTRNRLTS